ncbi:hypothetical protein DM860_004513 [Cuscuta australis]|uniref:RING-type domain-containing protein n=1 Tax=Cuscuta australis TaxID=267555 RepID=A0A328E7Z7_9ASTE|nr:hypothetical protein DM860_004513 [Cuscuta australis]
MSRVLTQPETPSLSGWLIVILVVGVVAAFVVIWFVRHIVLHRRRARREAVIAFATQLASTDFVAGFPRCTFDPAAGDGATDSCAICLGQYEPGEELPMFLPCFHPFHALCLTQWLARTTLCPTCGASTFVS